MLGFGTIILSGKTELSQGKSQGKVREISTSHVAGNPGLLTRIRTNVSVLNCSNLLPN